MNNVVNSDEQCVNNDFCPLHSEPMWGYCSRTGKKKKSEKMQNLETQTPTPNTHLVPNFLENHMKISFN